MIKSLVSNFIGFLQASRIPNLLIIAATMTMVAVHLLNISYDEVLKPHFIFFLGSTLLIAAAGYIINDYYDQKIDMVNRPSQVIIGIRFNRRWALAAHFSLSMVGISLGFILNKFIGIIHIFSATSLWAYSNHFRRLPFIGNLIIASLTGLMVIIVAVYFNKYNDLVVAYALFAGTITMIREIIKDIEDVKGDKTFGCQTIPVVWGIRGAKWVIYIIAFIGSVFLLIFLLNQNDNVLWSYFGASFPLYIWFIYKLITADKQSQYHFLHLFCNAIIFTGILSIIFL